MSYLSTYFHNNYKGLIATGAILGGYSLTSPFVACAGAGYLTTRLCDFLSRQGHQFAIRENYFYQRSIQPYIPKFVDSTAKIIDEFCLKNTAAVACGIASSIFVGGLYSSLSYLTGLVCAKVCNNNNSQRKQIAEENKIIMRNNGYVNSLNQFVSLKETPYTWAVRTVYDLQEIQRTIGDSNFCSRFKFDSSNFIEVINEDCLSACQRETQLGRNPVILNNANQHHPGGGYLKGSMAQEEDLLRRTPDVYGQLDRIYRLDNKEKNPEYKLFYNASNRHGCIYIKGAHLARNKEEYSLMNHPVPIDIISSSAPNLNPNLRGYQEEMQILGIMGFMKKLNELPLQEKQKLAKFIQQKIKKDVLFKKFDFDREELVIDNKLAGIRFRELVNVLPEEIIIKITGNNERRFDVSIFAKYGYEEYTKMKIYWQIKTAVETGHDTFIVSPWGCGAFRNDPTVISRYYKEVYEKYFQGQIRLIFTILGQQNLEAFQRTFSDNIRK